MGGYYVLIKEERHGPMSEDEVISLWIGDRISPETLFWRPGLKHWNRLAQFITEQQASSDAQPPPAVPRAPEPLTASLDEERPHQSSGFQWIYRTAGGALAVTYLVWLYTLFGTQIFH